MPQPWRLLQAVEGFAQSNDTTSCYAGAGFGGVIAIPSFRDPRGLVGDVGLGIKEGG